MAYPFIKPILNALKQSNAVRRWDGLQYFSDMTREISFQDFDSDLSFEISSNSRSVNGNFDILGSNLLSHLNLNPDSVMPLGPCRFILIS